LFHPCPNEGYPHMIGRDAGGSDSSTLKIATTLTTWPRRASRPGRWSRPARPDVRAVQIQGHICRPQPGAFCRRATRPGRCRRCSRVRIVRPRTYLIALLPPSLSANGTARTPRAPEAGAGPV
jgi:hypothetical protein